MVESFPNWSCYTKEPEIGAMRLPRMMRRASHYGLTQPSVGKYEGSLQGRFSWEVSIDWHKGFFDQTAARKPDVQVIEKGKVDYECHGWSIMA